MTDTPRKFRWSPEHLGPVVSGIAREHRWLGALPAHPFTREHAELCWGVRLHEARRRLQALVFIGLLVRHGRDGHGFTLYVRC